MLTIVYRAVLRTSKGELVPQGISDTASGGLTLGQYRLHIIRMIRTTLMLDKPLLDEALRLSGERTYSAAVNRALDDLVRRIRARRILDLGGKGLWRGDLAEMRNAGRTGS